jgi:uroporphyrin-3 C-methyltransferase
MPLAPALPELGSALKELRNLRATRALAQPRGVAVPTPGAGT